MAGINLAPYLAQQGGSKTEPWGTPEENGLKPAGPNFGSSSAFGQSLVAPIVQGAAAAYAAGVNAGTITPPVLTLEFFGPFKKSEDYKVVGLESPAMVCGSLTSTTDFSTYPDRAILKLTNSTGGSLKVTGLAIRGKPVVQYARGFEWKWQDWERIENDGESLIEQDNDYIIDPAQLESVGDYLAKDSEPAPVYSLSIPGCHYEYEPGDVWHLELSYTIPGMPSEAELIDTDVEVLSVSVSRSVGGIGETQVECRPKPAAWAKTTSRRARLISAGRPQWLNNRGNTLLVAASTWAGQADYFCDGTADDVEIQAALDLAGEIGGVNVAMTGGTFALSVALTIPTGVTLSGMGPSTVITGIQSALVGISTSNGFVLNTSGDAVAYPAKTQDNIVGPVFSAGYAHTRGEGSQCPRGVPGTNLRKVGPVVTKFHLPSTDQGGVGAARAFVESPCVVFDDHAQKYRMVFTAGFGTVDTDYIESIYTSTSDDCVTWTTPTLLLQGASTSHFTGPVSWRESDGTIWLFYIHLTAIGYEGHRDCDPHIDAIKVNEDYSATVGSAVAILAPDGTKVDGGVHWMGQCVWHPNIVKHRGVYYLFFNASESDSGNWKESIGCAWANEIDGPYTVFDLPVRKFGGTNETLIVGDPCVYFEDGYWYMAYFGYDGTTAMDNLLYCEDRYFPGVDTGTLRWGYYNDNGTLRPSGLELDFDSLYAHKPWILKRGAAHFHFYTAVNHDSSTTDPRRCIALAVDGMTDVGASWIQSLDVAGTYNVIRSYASDVWGYFVLIKPITAHLVNLLAMEVLTAPATWTNAFQGYASIPYMMMLNPGVYRIRNTNGNTGEVRAVGAYGNDRFAELSWTDIWPA